MLEVFVAALALGFVFNAAPGAVFAETVRHAVRGGFRPAFAVQVGSLAGDATWAVLGLSGVGVLMQSDVLRLPVGIAGALYLFWLAFDSWKAASHEFSVEGEASAPTGAPLRTGVVLSMTNPQNIAFWAAVGSALGALGVADPQPLHYAVFFAGFMTASVAWAVICAAALGALFKRTSARWARLTYRVCAVALLMLALTSLRNVVGEFEARRSFPQPQPSMQTPELGKRL
jgi:chemosensory pili system protein ChpE